MTEMTNRTDMTEMTDMTYMIDMADIIDTAFLYFLFLLYRTQKLLLSYIGGPFGPKSPIFWSKNIECLMQLTQTIKLLVFSMHSDVMPELYFWNLLEKKLDSIFELMQLRITAVDIRQTGLLMVLHLLYLIHTNRTISYNWLQISYISCLNPLKYYLYIYYFLNPLFWLRWTLSIADMEVDSVALLESFRALKLTLLESLRALELLKP